MAGVFLRLFFFLQAEDGIRAHCVTGVQTCALPISLGQAEALNRLGELSLCTSATGQARDQHTRALAIARDIRAAPEEARALEGLGRAHIQDRNHDQGLECLRQALMIYQRIGGPGAKRVQETLRKASSPESTERPDPGVTAPHPADRGRT